MENKGRNFSFTALKTTEEKFEEIQKPEVKKIIEGVNEEENSASKEALQKLKAMQRQYAESIMTVNIGGPIPYSEWENFDSILKEYKKEDKFEKPENRKGWSQKKLAASYILEGIKRDLKKIKK